MSRDGWRGLYVELCRAIAIAALGPNADYQFRPLELPRDVEALRHGDFDVAFLTGSEIVKQSLSGAISPGPPVFYESYTIMTEKTSSAHVPEDLAGAAICFNQARSAHLPLEDRFTQKGLEFTRLGFEEDVEFLDAYNSRYCKAAVGEATELALMRLQSGVNHLESRVFEPLAVFPVLAVTPTQDSRWSSTVAWVIHFVQAAERKETAWRVGGAKTRSANARDLGLDAAWRENVFTTVGDYGAMYERSLGEKSPFKLTRGVNALWSAGGLMAPPFGE